jgi:hypothetical protein
VLNGLLLLPVSSSCSCSCLHPHFANISVQRHFPRLWLLHISTPLPFCLFGFAGLGRYKLASGYSVKPCPAERGIRRTPGLDPTPPPAPAEHQITAYYVTAVAC